MRIPAPRLPTGLLPPVFFFFFQAEDGIRDFCLSRGLGDVYKRQEVVLRFSRRTNTACDRFTRRTNTHCVGGDAYIAPAGRTDFMVILNEFGTFQRADVGIGPYA